MKCVVTANEIQTAEDGTHLPAVPHSRANGWIHFLCGVEHGQRISQGSHRSHEGQPDTHSQYCFGTMVCRRQEVQDRYSVPGHAHHDTSQERQCRCRTVQPRQTHETLIGEVACVFTNALTARVYCCQVIVQWCHARRLRLIVRVWKKSTRYHALVRIKHQFRQCRKKSLEHCSYAVYVGR